MSVKVHSIIRSVADLSSSAKFEGLANVDRFTIHDPYIIDAYQSNPFLRSAEHPAELVGVVDGRIMGRVGLMPMRMIADDSEYETVANPGILVDPEYRKTGFALELLEFGNQNCKDKIRLDFYVSKTARKVMKLWGGAVFDILQFALVRRSSLFFSDRLPAVWAFVVCSGLDIVFFFHRVLVKVLLLLQTATWRVFVADDADSLHEFAELVRADSHRFRNDVSEIFLDWILKHDFRGVMVANKHLWRFIRDGKTIGFVLMRKDHTGRGRIIDWQATPGNERFLPLMILKAANRMLSSCKAVVISVSSADTDIVRYLSRRCLHLPTQAATVSAGYGSPLTRHEGWRVQSNWRIRPTMGDSCLY